MAQATRTCPGCGRSVNAAVPVCPFCGRRAEGAPPAAARPAPHAAMPPPPPGARASLHAVPSPPKATRPPPHAAMPSPATAARFAPRAVTPLPPTAARPAPDAAMPPPLTGPRAEPHASVPSPLPPAAPSTALPPPRCPRCGAPPGRTPLRVQVWKQIFHWNPGVRRFRVLSADLPGPCEECARWVARRRWLAAVYLVAPFLLGALAAGFGGIVPGVVTGVYGLYLVRAGSYGWADLLLYGGELEVGSSARIPRHPEGEGSVRFPGPLHHAVVRIGVAAVLGASLAFIGFASGARKGGLPPLTDVEVLSRTQVVYVPVAGEPPRWTVEVVDGRRAALAYAAWEDVPAGPAEQMSPQRAFERALEDAGLEAVVIDPGPKAMLVRRRDFDRMRLHLPPWPTPEKAVTKRPPAPRDGPAAGR